MQITVDSKQRAARAAVLVFSILLTPWTASASSLSAPPEFYNADNSGESQPRNFPDATSAGDMSSASARETRLNRLRDMAIEASIADGNPSATVLSPFRAPHPSSPAPSAAPSDPSLIKDLSRSIKETVRPTYEDAVNSGVVDAIRSLIGTKPDHQTGFNGVNSGDHGEKDPRHLATDARTWDGPNVSTPALSPEQKAADQVRAGILLRALIDEITPWAFSAAGAYLLYKLVKFGLAYLRRKSGRHRRRRSGGSGSSGSSNASGSGRSHRHRSRSAPHSESAELDRSVKNPANSPAP